MHDRMEAPTASQRDSANWVSVAALQCRIRQRFRDNAPFRAVSMSLDEIGQRFEADHVAIHAYVHGRPLSEEWTRKGFEMSDSLRERVTTALARTIDTDEPRCFRLGENSGGSAISTAPLLDEDGATVGAVGLVFRSTSRAQAYTVLAQLEALAGLVATLLSKDSVARNGHDAATSADLDHPLRVLLELHDSLVTRFPLSAVAIGLVYGNDVQVACVDGRLGLRRNTPGVLEIRDLMRETLDAGATIQQEVEDSGFTFHRQWIRSRDVGAAVSFPLGAEGRPIAILVAAAPTGVQLEEVTVTRIQAEAENYTPMLDLAGRASRSLSSHAFDTVGNRLRRLHLRIKLALIGLAAIAVTWLAFGSLPYHVTVPAKITSSGRRILSSPRDGTLADVFVKPGDMVHSGQILAELDTHDDQLSKAELDAELIAVEAEIDVAIGEHDSGKIRVLRARRDGIEANASILARRIADAQIRAPHNGILLDGDLSERIGSRLSVGDPLFEVARWDRCQLRMDISEEHVIPAQHASAVSFVTIARPRDVFATENFHLAPASVVRGGKNVFPADADILISVDELPPGIEGFATLELGDRNALWVLSHRLTDWIRVNLWL